MHPATRKNCVLQQDIAMRAQVIQTLSLREKEQDAVQKPSGGGEEEEES